MSKMAELDSDRQRIERLMDVVCPPTFAASRAAGFRLHRIRTKYDPPSIPVRAFDWSAVTDDYEPGHPVGYGYTEQQAIDDLRELTADRADAS